MQYKQKTIPGGVAQLVPPSENNEMRSAIVTIDGEYPEVGSYAVNEDKTEALFIHEGHIVVEKEGKRYNLEQGDSVYLEPNKKYRISGDATVFVAIAPGDAATTKIVQEHVN